MKRLVLSIVLSVLLSGCTTGAQLLSGVEDAPKWFVDQIPEAEAKGYPTVSETPQNPADIPDLHSWDIKLEKLKSKGEVLQKESREQASSKGISTGEFLRSSLERADIEKFNAEEEAQDIAAHDKKNE